MGDRWPPFPTPADPREGASGGGKAADEASAGSGSRGSVGQPDAATAGAGVLWQAPEAGGTTKVYKVPASAVVGTFDGESDEGGCGAVNWAQGEPESWLGDYSAAFDVPTQQLGATTFYDSHNLGELLQTSRQ